MCHPCGPQPATVRNPAQSSMPPPQFGAACHPSGPRAPTSERRATHPARCNPFFQERTPNLTVWELGFKHVRPMSLRTLVLQRRFFMNHARSGVCVVDEADLNHGCTGDSSTAPLHYGGEVYACAALAELSQESRQDLVMRGPGRALHAAQEANAVAELMAVLRPSLRHLWDRNSDGAPIAGRMRP